MYFTFKGEPSYHYGITVNKRPTYSIAPLRIQQYDAEGVDGSYLEYEGRQSYIIQMDITVQGEENREAINGWLKGFGKFTRSDYKDRYINVEYQSGLNWRLLGHDMYQTPITFYAYDPFWYKEDEYQPITETVVNEGNYQSRPSLRIVRGTSDSVDFTINGIRGIYFFKYPNSKEVEIDFKKNTVLEDGVNMKDRLMIGYTRPQLNPGENKVEIVGNTKSFMIKGKDRWV